MMETAENIIVEQHQKKQTFFRTNKTKDISFRLTQLRKLKNAILTYQDKLSEALWQDLHKSPEEAYLTEISIVLGEINYHIKNLKKWAKPQKVKTPIHLLPSSSRIFFEPLGVSLIIAPWNYPFQLLINSLVGAISSGCCTILKPSPDTPNVATLVQAMIEETFPNEYISVIQGGKDTNTILLQQKFDIIFFTGSTHVGKIVMKAAADNLTPVVLELGGKSPCIVDADANIDIAAKRIVWGKLLNAGQTCIAPDYLFVHESIKEKLLHKMAVHIKQMFGENPQESRFYPRIVNQAAIERLNGLLNEGDIFIGGTIDKKDRYIAPTIINNVTQDCVIMQNEIFGPILPVLNFKHIKEVINYVVENEKPLAFYYFGTNKNAVQILTQTSSGGACINDTIMHVSNHHLPFGGVGNSGLGKYHGYDSFLAFSNQRSVFKTPTWIDLPLKYVPFKNFKLIKKLI